MAADILDVCDGLAGSVGHTPLIELKSLSRITGARILAKAEFLSPGGSVKDRPALAMVLKAEERGDLSAGSTIVEATGGNTGIGLALVARARGYKFICVMNRTISIEKQQLLRTFGAELVLTDPCPFTDQNHYYHVAQRIAQSTPGAWYSNQFENLDNSSAHFDTTGPEIWTQTRGEVSAFVAAAGTGGTIAGVSDALKQRNQEIECWLIDMPGGVLFEYLKSGTFKPLPGPAAGLEGIGIDRLTANFKRAAPLLTGALSATALDAIDMAYYVLSHEGLFIGSSAAFNLVGACRVARDLVARRGPNAEGRPPVVVTILCDSGDRYVSKIYNENWLADMKAGLKPEEMAADKGLQWVATWEKGKRTIEEVSHSVVVWRKES
ncbi:cysteine synthase [Gonapodya prolifera JEL478]|uniref:Cysteine synthase n=1 Tax=Gonapodya prolifera (strain JEL478) TaxID=1344416 RepID=A0A139AU43_GONPJ|nr:cysteine synthase [Gonapodya prolifera JEL478]|eukprot:KXS20227.1 cysteine synthase [Gonapodya prolifera JEL478]